MGVGSSQLFPSLFELVVNIEVKVVEVWDLYGVEGEWSSCFPRNLNEWKIEELEHFFSTLRGKRVILGREDVMLLKDSKDGNFTSRLSYEILA